MICNMLFNDGNVDFRISELLANGKILFQMDDGDNAPYGYSIELDLHDLRLLQEWIDKSVKTLEEYAEPPTSAG